MRTALEIEQCFAKRMALDGARHFTLVGIGGAGMSAIARMLKRRGYEVSGTDAGESPETDRLRMEGIKVSIGHSKDAVSSDDILVVSDAIDLSESPEVAEAKRLGVPLVRRSQVLGWLLKGRKVIAVTGTHGKTTTTGMVGAGLIEAGMDPLVVVGAAIPSWGGPVREGRGEWAVVEACEAYDALRDIDPQIVVLTNIEPDHLDFHGTEEALKRSVSNFLMRIPDEGRAVVCREDAGAKELGQALGHVDWYGVDQASELEEAMILPGLHNALNAAGALVACTAAGADRDRSKKGITNFMGAERRLQVLLEGPITVIDDYAHHPTEITASIQAIRARFALRSGARLVVVYQPHLYSRTEYQIEAFAEALAKADQVVLTDIYPAREAPIPGVSSSRIAERLGARCLYVPSRHLLPRTVAKSVHPGDVIVGMGAGTIAEFAPEFIHEIDRTLRLKSGRSGTRVAVVFGGESAEREVSLHSGRAVSDALRRKGYEVSLVDVTEVLLKTGLIDQFRGEQRPDIAFLAVHGTHAEDGAIQGFFELLHIPYTGSGIESSAIAMNKAFAKQVFASAGLRVPRGELLTSRTQVPNVGPPCIVKPNAQGSTVGLSFVEREDQLLVAIEMAFNYDSQVLVEEWVSGMEISVPMLGDRALPPVEIAPTTGRYDFASKYVPGATEEVVPARLPQVTINRVQAIAALAHEALACRGATRTDMIVPEPFSESEPIVLELNTLPGLTSTSLLPNSAAAAGIPFDDLVDWIVQDALART